MVLNLDLEVSRHCYGDSCSSTFACCLGIAVQHAAALLERRHHSSRRHRALARVLSVAHGVGDHLLDEGLQHTSDLFVEKAADALDTRARARRRTEPLVIPRTLSRKTFFARLPDVTAFASPDFFPLAM